MISPLRTGSVAFLEPSLMILASAYRFSESIFTYFPTTTLKCCSPLIKILSVLAFSNILFEVNTICGDEKIEGEKRST